MNFNVYVDRETGERLARLARQRRVSRNALIREALARMLKEAARPGWPAEVVAFEGDRAAPRFEQTRARLRPPSDDPLA